MKNLRTAITCALLALGMLTANAQSQSGQIPLNEPNYNKPRLFNAIPDQVTLGSEKILNLLSLQVGTPVTLALTDQVTGQFNGEVISATRTPDSKVQTVIIRSTNFNGAVLTLSQVNGPDGKYYTGRIISMQHGDLFVLEQQGLVYRLIKKNFYDLINE